MPQKHSPTAAIAELVVPLVRDHGVEYLFAATILMGIVQGIAGFMRDRGLSARQDWARVSKTKRLGVAGMAAANLRRQ